jgi:hypothetical protein
MSIDLNHHSGFVYGRASASPPVAERIDALIDASLMVERAAIAARDYLGASRIGGSA